MVTRAGDRASARERRGKVLDLYADGLSLLGISRELKITPAQAKRRLGEAIAELPAQDVEELRAGAEVRLDRVASGLVRLIDRTDDDRVFLSSLQALAKIEDQRARLLGLNQKAPAED